MVPASPTNASYTSKYVGVLEGDLGVLSVKVPLKSLTELQRTSDGSTVYRPGSAPGGARGPSGVTATGVAGMGSSGPVPAQPGHASLGAIVHGSFAPRALRVNSQPRRPTTAGARRHPTVERVVPTVGGPEHPMQPFHRPSSAASTRNDQPHLVHNAISGFRLTTPAARKISAAATRPPPPPQQLQPWAPTIRAPSPARSPAPTPAPYDTGPAGPGFALGHSWGRDPRAVPPPRMPLPKTSVSHTPELYLQYCKVKMSMGQ